MIAVDSSALVAIAFDEPRAGEMLAAILENPCRVGAPTLLETTLVVDGQRTLRARDALARIMALRNFEIIPFDGIHALLAREAYARYGKGRGHPAQLNFGDCMAYAIARRDDLPLLYKGDDFARTDARPALA